MFYYKILDENGNINRLISSTAPVYNAIEITEAEYREFIPNNNWREITEEEYAEVLKAEESEV